MNSDNQVDIIENTIRRHINLLEILLIDRTRSTSKKNHNLIWATDSYAEHKVCDEIKVEDITGDNTFLIQPRIAKSKEEQKARTREKAEVFTPKSIVYEMNQQVDWNTGHWPAIEDNWQDYVNELRLEITCGEAPFIVNRYNAFNGKKVLKLTDRVGFLDRKMQIVSSYCKDKESWIEWSKNAYKASYGYEWQGDNLLLARENLLYTFIDYWNEQFPDNKINLERQVAEDKMKILLEIAEIISWNIFQMDGIKFVVPMSCKHEIVTEELPPMALLWGEMPEVTKNECTGCKYGDPKRHNGKYVYVMDWEKNKKTKFINLLK